MKMLLLLSFFVVLTSFSGKIEIVPGDPIPGRDIKLGRTPPSSLEFFTSTTSEKDGSFKFKDLAPGEYTYFIEIDIKEKEGKGDNNIRIDGIGLPINNTGKKLSEKEKPTIIRTVDTAEYGMIEVTIRSNSKSIVGSINKVKLDVPANGSINKSRSNIKG